MLAAGGSIEKGQIGSIIYSAKFPLKHHLLCRGHTIFGKRNNRQFKSIILCLEMKKNLFSETIPAENWAAKWAQKPTQPQYLRDRASTRLGRI